MAVDVTKARWLATENPDLIDVYRISESHRRRFRRAKSVEAMIEITGKRYG